MMYLQILTLLLAHTSSATLVSDSKIEQRLWAQDQPSEKHLERRSHGGNLQQLLPRARLVHKYAGMVRAADMRRSSEQPKQDDTPPRQPSPPAKRPQSAATPAPIPLVSGVTPSSSQGLSSRKGRGDSDSKSSSRSSSPARSNVALHGGSSQSLLQESPSSFLPSHDSSRHSSRSPSPRESTKAYGSDSRRSTPQSSPHRPSLETKWSNDNPSPASTQSAETVRARFSRSSSSNRSLGKTPSSLISYMSAQGPSRTSSAKRSGSLSDPEALRNLGSFSMHSPLRGSSSREQSPPQDHSRRSPRVPQSQPSTPSPPSPPSPIIALEGESPRKAPLRAEGLFDSPTSVRSGRWPRTQQIIPGAEHHSPVHSMLGDQGSTPPNSPSAGIRGSDGRPAGLGDSPGSLADSTQAILGSPTLPPYNLLRIRTRYHRQNQQW